MGFFDKIKAGLKKTRENISSQIHSMLHAFTKIDEELFEELEELLVMADVGVNTAEHICDTLRARVAAGLAYICPAGWNLPAGPFLLRVLRCCLN